MECEKRIIIDMRKFDENLNEINHISFTQEEKEIIERAKSYKEDCKYYLNKGDELSSFGCITYAHGLIDAIKLNRGLN